VFAKNAAAHRAAMRIINIWQLWFGPSAVIAGSCIRST